MTSLYKFAAAGLLSAVLPLAQAAGPVVVTDHVRSELLIHAPQGVQPGKTLWVGLAIDHQPHWHTYWKNPGDSGLPTTLNWKLPAGFAAGDIAWPTPKKLPLGPLTNYGYENKLLLPVPVQVPAGFAGQELKVGLRAEWLVCKEICLPESGEFEITVPANASPSSHGALFDAARAAMPVAVQGASATAQVDGKVIAIDVRGLPAQPQGEVHYFAEDVGVIDYAAKVEQQWVDGTLRLRVPLSPQRSESPAVLKAVLVAPGQAAGWTLSIPVEGTWPAPGSASPAPAPAPVVAEAPAAPAGETSFMLSLLFAFLGGALLNLMPCVFPVLSLKIFSLVQHREARGRAVAGGVAYTVGVVLSFVVLAGLLLALRAGGAELGWGFQLQSPLVVAGLAALFTVIGLNLAGVFEFGGVLPGAVAGYCAKNPLVDDALGGALAVAVASPCTAPFMGAALGVALTEPAPQALTIFAVLGLGMAAPYLAVALVPPLGRLLPRPGTWMVRFKVLMAFPMFATVVWLLWVLGQQTGIDAMAGVAGLLVALAFACWAVGTPAASRRTRIAFVATGLIVLAGTGHLVWPLLKVEPAAQAHAAGGWSPWSTTAVGQARAAGKPVFVDFTAAWCITCQFNKRTVLSDAQLLKDFGAKDVVLLRADWTRRDPAITRQLAELGRNGVPVYVLYGPNDSRPPQVLSEVLTVEQVRTALGKI